jgi:hypothetical protein
MRAIAAEPARSLSERAMAIEIDLAHRVEHFPLLP